MPPPTFTCNVTSVESHSLTWGPSSFPHKMRIKIDPAYLLGLVERVKRSCSCWWTLIFKYFLLWVILWAVNIRNLCLTQDLNNFLLFFFLQFAYILYINFNFKIYQQLYASIQIIMWFYIADWSDEFNCWIFFRSYKSLAFLEQIHSDCDGLLLFNALLDVVR